MNRRALIISSQKKVVNMEIDISDFGSSYPFSEFGNMNQARVINGDGIITVNNYSYINNQPAINYCPIISAPSFPSVDGNIIFTLERNSNSNTKNTETYITPLGEGYYKHTVTLSTPLLLETGKQYCFLVRNQGETGYFGYKKIAVRNGSAIPNFGVFFGADLINYNASSSGTTWNTWYEARFSYEMEHPFYLELNGTSV